MYSIDRYLNVKQAYMPSFSSDGRWLAFISDLTGVPQAWRAPLGAPGSSVPMPEQLTFAEDRVLWLRCSPAPGDHGLTYPLLVDEEMTVNNLYGILNLPTTIFIDANGIVREVLIGTMSRAVLEERIEKLVGQ